MHGHERLDLLVVGSANADLVVRVARRPAAGETVLGSDLMTRPGGKGANQAAAAARLGARTGLLGKVGGDEHGRLLLTSLREAGADTAAVAVADAPTGAALITVDSSGDNSIVVSPGANERLTPDDVAAAAPAMAEAAVVSVQLEIPRETVVATVRAARRAQTRVVLNPSPPERLPEEVLPDCDPLVLNEHEARALLGDGAGDTAEAWARGLLARGPRSVVITLGAGGALAAEPRGSDQVSLVRVPSPEVEAVDTTGAGDAFAGALAWRLSRGSGLADAVAYAVHVGALAVTKDGAQESYPSAEEVEKLRQHGGTDGGPGGDGRTGGGEETRGDGGPGGSPDAAPGAGAEAGGAGPSA